MTKKQIIIMDEVDGMAGGDRGGVAQLISFIKKTHVSRGIESYGT
jgi:replication factor C subunit 1